MSRFISYIDLGMARTFEQVKLSCRVDDLSLACFRTFFAWYILLFDAPFFLWMASVPQGFFSPPILSFANLFDDFLPVIWFYAGDLLSLGLLGCVALGIRARLTGRLLAVTVIFFSGFQYGFGKIDHDILVWVSLLGLSFTNWGTRLALVPDRPVSVDRQATALGLIGVFIAYGLLTAGLEKAFNWMDFNLQTSGFLRWFYNGYFNLGRQALLMPFVFDVPMLLIELGEYMAVLFEISGFYFLIRSPRLWRIWLLTACIFHFGNTLVLNISFYIHVVVYGLFLLTPVFRQIVSGLIHTSNKAKYRLLLSMGTIALILGHVWQRSFSEGSRYLFIQDYAVELEVELMISLGVWFCMILTCVYGLILFSRDPVHSNLPKKAAPEVV